MEPFWSQDRLDLRFDYMFAERYMFVFLLDKVYGNVSSQFIGRQDIEKLFGSISKNCHSSKQVSDSDLRFSQSL